MRSRVAYSVPYFQDLVQRRLSDFALDKVRGEYDQAVVDGDNIQEDRRTTMQIGHALCFAYVSNTGLKAIVKCERWTCTCPHYITLRLPCRHFIVAAQLTLLLAQLPVEVGRQCWNIAHR